MRSRDPVYPLYHSSNTAKCFNLSCTICWKLKVYSYQWQCGSVKKMYMSSRSKEKNNTSAKIISQEYMGFLAFVAAALVFQVS